jgi:hypothetical protein
MANLRGSRRGTRSGPVRLARPRRSGASLPVCRHDGFYSATSRYERQAGVLRFVLVCDGCGCEVREVGRVQYRPRFDCGPTSSLAA